MSPSIPQLLPPPWVPKINFCFQIRAPGANQDFVCLLWGKAEVRVAFNDRADRYHSRNLVTERAVIGLYDLIVERARYHSCNLVTERDVTERVSACERLRCSLRGRLHIPLQG